MTVGVIVGVTVGVGVNPTNSILVPSSLTIVIAIDPVPMYFSPLFSFPEISGTKETTSSCGSSAPETIYGSHLDPLPLLLYLTRDNAEREGVGEIDTEGVTDGDCVTVAVTVAVIEGVGVGVGKDVSVGLGVGSTVFDGVAV